jgi:hypothetical protein
MARTESDAARERRIENEVLVDAYSSEEAVLGWYYYLQGKLQFPQPALWLKNRHVSYSTGEAVNIVSMADEDVCDRDMFVEIALERDQLSVRLDDIVAPEADEQTQVAIADWHYWCDRGYSFDDDDEGYA